MKKTILIFILTFLLISITLGQEKSSFYVSLKGNDSWSGKLAEPNKQKTDGPFATLDKAKNTIREIKKSTGLPKGGIEVNIREGIYSFDKTITFTEADAGTNESPVKWCAFKNENVFFAGGKVISGFEKIKDKMILNRIDKPYQNKILQIDLKKIGITNYGEITPRKSCGLELFFNDKRMMLARYPNSGFLTITDVPQTGETMFNKGLDREKRYDGVPCGRHYGRIKYSDERPSRWKDTVDIFAHGYWTFDWSDSYQRIKAIDTKNKEVIFQEPHHWYGYTKNQRYYFVNILEELDSPGEWYLDRKAGILYFWPPSSIKKGTAIVSILEDQLVSLKNCQNLTIQGIKFEYSRGNAITMNDGVNNLIAGCTFTNLGSTAVKIDGGMRNGITGCDVYEVALGGISIKGGDRKTLAPAGNFASNNHVHHYSAWVRTGQQGIDIIGVGNRLSNNLIHDAPHEGVYLSGNDHILEYNEIHDVCTETGDAGAIHTGRDYTWRGNIYRYNYFHHLKGPGLHGVTAIYWDDFTSGYTAYGNVCYKSGRGVLIGGGRDNIVENNMFIDCHPSIVLDARGLGWASNYFDGQITYLLDKFKEVNGDQPPYTTKYPELKTILNDTPAVPKNNKIVKNISYNGRFIELLDYFSYDFSVQTIKDNLIADPEICKRIKEDPKGWEPYYLNLDVSDGYRVWKNGDKDQMDFLKQNTIINKDPGFVNYKKGNFRLKEDSPALKMGFQQIPFEKIGLYVDQYRKSIK